MAMQLVCDVHGTTVDVVPTLITRSVMLNDNWVEMTRFEADLSKPAAGRADKLLEEAVTKPGHGKRPVVTG